MSRRACEREIRSNSQVDQTGTIDYERTARGVAAGGKKCRLPSWKIGYADTFTERSLAGNADLWGEQPRAPA